MIRRQTPRRTPDARDRSAVIELVLAESYPILLEGMDHMFRSTAGFRVLTYCSSGDEALRAVQEHRPDILILDFRIPGKSALDVIREIVRGGLPTRVVVLADRIDEAEMLVATRCGARGIILKRMASHMLIECVRKVHRGAVWIEKVSMGRIVDRLVQHDAGYAEAAGRLTTRELEVVRMVARSQSNKEIADKLSISEGTVKAHLHHVYEKLSIRGRLELSLYARDKGLVSVWHLDQLAD